MEEDKGREENFKRGLSGKKWNNKSGRVGKMMEKEIVSMDREAIRCKGSHLSIWGGKVDFEEIEKKMRKPQAVGNRGSS